MQSRISIKALMLYGSGNDVEGHPYRTWFNAYFPEVICRAAGPSVEITAVQQTAALSDLMSEKYDVFINNSMFMAPSVDEFEALFRFVSEGGGFMALHTGLVSFLNDPRYEQMLGARFIGHSPIKALAIDPRDAWYGLDEAAPRHPVTDGVGTFGVVDELYVEQFNTEDVTILARSELLPVMWVRSFGRGRVACLSLGHDEASIGTRNFGRLLANGLHWAAGKDR